MFGLVKKNWLIGKAVNLARNDFGIDVDRVTGIVTGLSDPNAMQLRENARHLIDSLSLNDKELALLLVAPFAANVSSFQQTLIEEKIAFWRNLGVIRADIADHVIAELSQSKQ